MELRLAGISKVISNILIIIINIIILPLPQQYKDEQGKCGFMAKTGDSSLISLQHLPLPFVKGDRHWQKAIKESRNCHGRAPTILKT